MKDSKGGEGPRALTEASMPLVAVMLEGIMLGFLYRNATTGPFFPAGIMQRIQPNGTGATQKGRAVQCTLTQNPIKRGHQ